MHLISVGGGPPATLSMQDNIRVYVYFIINGKAHGYDLDALKSEHVYHLAVPVWRSQ